MSSATLLAACGSTAATSGVEPGVDVPGEVLPAPDAADAVTPLDQVTPPDVAVDTTAPGCACGDHNCSATCGESLANCPADCATCGDKVCSPGEAPATCVEDCCGACGDGLCKGYACGENPEKCPDDCGKACGNQTCEKGESPATCPTDCKFQACGNQVCEPEDGGPQACPQDCGTACGNCVCEKGESWTDCPGDCGFCGDAICSNCAGLGESSSTCPADCKSDGCKDPSGKACDDGIACTADLCGATGACIHLPDASGCSDDSVCTTDSCDPASGCKHVAVAGSCDDGDPCTTGDQCMSGVCKGQGSCADAGGGDAGSNADGGSLFGDGGGVSKDAGATTDGGEVAGGFGASCLGGYDCDSGVCVQGVNGKQCSKTCVDECPAGWNCVQSSDGGDLTFVCKSTACNQMEWCNGKDDNCNGQTDEDLCNDEDICTTDSCTAEGACKHVPVVGVPACDKPTCKSCSFADNGDGTVTLSCSDGSSVGFDKVGADGETGADGQTGAPCQPGGPGGPGGPGKFPVLPNFSEFGCTVTDEDANTKLITCSCDFAVAVGAVKRGADGANGMTGANGSMECSDGNVCTDPDGCDAGQCVGTAKDCNDNIACTADSCDAVSGCVHTANATLCNDDNLCTDDACDVEGCSHTQNTAPCSEPACNVLQFTGAGVCAAGECVATSKTCDDANACTTDACALPAGCTHTSLGDGTGAGGACAPNDGCSIGAMQCQAGAASCVTTSTDAAKEGKACGTGGGVCKSGLCYLNQAPSVVSAAFAAMPMQPGAAAALTVMVADPNTDSGKSVNDITSVVVDATSIGGAASVALTWTIDAADTHGGTYSASLATAGLIEGAYLLPVTVTDSGGLVAKSLAPLYIYTGAALHVGNGQTYANIKAAITAAVDGDAVIVHDGTYTGTSNKNLALSGKKILVIGQTSTANTIIDCQANLRAFSLTNSTETSQAVVARLTIQNCVASAIRLFADQPAVAMNPSFVELHLKNNSNSDKGGAVVVQGLGVNPTFALSKFSGNTTANGGQYDGGVMVLTAAAQATLAHCEFTGNSAQAAETIRAEDTCKLTLNDCHFHANSGGTAVVHVDGAAASLTMSGGEVTAETSTDGINVSTGEANISGVNFHHNVGGSLRVTVTNYSGAGTPLSVTNCRFEANEGESLYAISYITEGNGSISGCKFVNNKARALYATDGYGKLAISNCLFSGNHHSLAPVELAGPIALSNSQFSANISDSDAGALLVSASGVAVSNCVFDSNQALGAQGKGGALRILDYYSSIYSVKSSVFTNNQAANGGAIYISRSASTYPNTAAPTWLSNLLLTGNKATDSGGAIYLDVSPNGYGASFAGPLNLRALTVANNTAAHGGGIYVNQTDTTMDYCAIWGNTTTGTSGTPGHQMFVNSTTADIKLAVKFSSIANGDGDIADDGGKVNGQTFFESDGYGNLEKNPLFVKGPKGDYYLSQTASGQATQSPCVDPAGTGVTKAVDAGFDQWTTRTDGVKDAGNLDMGYHYLP